MHNVTQYQSLHCHIPISFFDILAVKIIIKCTYRIGSQLNYAFLAQTGIFGNGWRRKIAMFFGHEDFLEL